MTAFIELFAMWASMMAAMMLPGAMPAIARRRGASRRLAFVAGYFGVWTAFSALAAFAQLVLGRNDLLSEDMALRPPLAAAGIVLVAALYQATASKRRFLLDRRARAAATSGEGAAETFIAGARYGRSCMGSSALLMLLLFVAGVMNLAAMLALCAWVAIEKLPRPAPRAASKPL